MENNEKSEELKGSSKGRPDPGVKTAKKGVWMNALAMRQNQKRTVIAVSIVGVLLLGGAVFLSLHGHKEQEDQAVTTSTDVEGFESIANYNKSATTAVIGTLQDATSETQDHVAKLEKEDAALQAKYQTLAEKLASFQNAQVRSPVVMGNLGAGENAGSVGNGGNVGNGGFADFGASYPKAHAPSLAACRPNNCVLPGTFVKAVLLGGADADASVEGQSNTTPILFRILGPATLPNGYHVDLKGCFVVGEVYGDISSQRGEVKLAQISCVREGHMMSQRINGIADDIGGKEGIRGIPVYKAGTMLALSGFSGFLSGFGNAVSQSYSTQTTSPIGTTTTPDTGHLFQIGAASGFGEAANNLSNFYIKLANQYHPIIQINAGSMVDLVFLSQFTLNTGVSKGFKRTQHFSTYWQSSPPGDSGESGERISLGSTLDPNEVKQVTLQMQRLGGGQ